MAAVKKVARKKTTRKAKPADQSVPEGSEIAEVKGTSAPVALGNMEALSGRGLENATHEDFTIPRLQLMQKSSPEVEDQADVNPGDFLLTNPRHVFKPDGEPVRVIPVHYLRQFVEQVPYDDGGGFVASYSPDHPIVGTAVRRGSKDVLPNGNELSNVMVFTVLVETPDGFVPAVMRFKSTGTKVGRKWITEMASQKMQGSAGMFTPPTYAYIYEFTSDRQKRDNLSWFVPVLGKSAPVTDEGVFQQADKLYSDCTRGAVKHEQESNARADRSEPGAQAGFDVDEGGDSEEPAPFE